MPVTHTLPVPETWQFAWCPHGQCRAPAQARQLTYRPASVPGTNVEDLLRLDLIRDPFVGLQFRDCYWIEMKDFWYRCEIEAEGEALDTADAATLCFDGIDTVADIWLNGRKLAETRNMFQRHRFEVKEFLKPGANELLICLHAPGKAGLETARNWGVDLPALNAAFQTQERLVIRKMQMSYGWDNTPRILMSGIYRPVSLVLRKGAALVDAAVRTEELDPGHSGATLRFDVTACHHQAITLPRLHVHGSGQGSGFEETVDLALDDDGAGHALVRVDNPFLWWPHTLGEPHLYHTLIELLDGDDIVDNCERNVGIAQIRRCDSPITMEPVTYRVGPPKNDTPDMDGADNGAWSHVPLEEPAEAPHQRLVFEVNGEPLPILGANWQPPDAIYSRIDDGALRALVTNARDTGLNMIRVWGGGYIERPAFYETCSELGILVWQDFPFACGTFPQVEPFLEEVRTEAEDIVRQLRSYACLAAWCGDNESDMIYHDRSIDPEQNRLNHEILPKTVEHLDPGRYFHVSSPSALDYPRSPWSGDNRNWGAWDPSDNYVHIRREESTFISEAGAYALPDMRTVETHIPASEWWPLNSETWDLHNGDVDTFKRHFWSRNKPMWEAFSSCDDIEAAVEVSQFAQAWGAKVLFEHCRARWPETGGVLWWKLNDCWPCMDGGLYDYELRPRMIVQAMRAAAAPALLCVGQPPREDKLELRLINHSDDQISGTFALEVWQLGKAGPQDGVVLGAEVMAWATGILGDLPLTDDLDPETTVFRTAVYETDAPVHTSVWALSPKAAWRCYRETDWIRTIWEH